MTMLRPSAICTLLILAAPSYLPAENESPSVVRFANGDRISGTLESLSPEVITWKSPILADVATFEVKNLLDITLPTPPLQPGKSQDIVATVSLTNGDVLKGELVGMNDATVSLATPFAGTLQLNRAMVKAIAITPGDTIYYAGPLSLDEWKIAENKGFHHWQFKDSALTSTGRETISRPDTLTDTCTLSFDVEWESDQLDLSIRLFAVDEPNDSAHAGYEFSINRAYINVRNLTTGASIANENIIGADLRTNNTANFEIRCDAKTATFWFFLDGQSILLCTDDAPAKDNFKHKALQFLPLNSHAKTFSNIIVKKWDGDTSDYVPNNGNLNRFQNFNNDIPDIPAAKEVPENQISLANKDTIEGVITAIKDQSATIKTPLGEFDLPLDRLNAIPMPAEGLEQAIRRSGDIRAFMPDGTSVVFRLLSADASGITGDSQNFGQATFKPGTFNRLEFNPHEFEYLKLRNKK